MNGGIPCPSLVETSPHLVAMTVPESKIDDSRSCSVLVGRGHGRAAGRTTPGIDGPRLMDHDEHTDDETEPQSIEDIPTMAISVAETTQMAVGSNHCPTRYKLVAVWRNRPTTLSAST